MKKKKVNLRDLKPDSETQHSHDDGHNHSNPEKLGSFRTYLPAIFSFVLLIIGIAVDYFDAFPYFKGWVRIVWYTV
ncbi:MAG: heavy metal translocating P-type ATPase, partial [Flavobacteriaceae bacterium]